MRTHGHRRRQLHRLRGRGGFFSTVTTVLLVAMALLLSPCLAEAYSLMPQDNGIREGQTVTINTIGSGYDSWYGEVNGTDWMAACVQLGPDSKPGSWTATARDLVGSPRHGGGTWNESQVRKCAIAQKYLLERLGQSDDAHKAFSAWVWHMSEQGGWDYHTEHVSSVRNLFASHSGGVSIAEVDNYVSEHYDDYRGYGWYFDPGNSLQAMAVFGLKPAPGYLTLNKYSDIEPTTLEPEPMVWQKVDDYDQHHHDNSPHGSSSASRHAIHDIKATAIDVEEDKVKTLQDTEREVIINAIERNHGKRRQTAEELGISERTLYRKIKEYGLEYRNNRK